MTNAKNSSTDRLATPLDPPAAPRIYTVAQLADILQIDARAVRMKVRAGTWPHLDLGPKTIRFTEAHLATILSQSEATQPPRLTRLHRRRGEPPRYAPAEP